MPSDLPRYRVGSWTLASAIALPELARAPLSVRPDWTVLASRPSRVSVAPWFHHWLAPNGERWLSFGRRPDGDYVLRVARHATFRVSVATRTITCEHPQRVPAFTLRHLLLNQIWPLALSVDRPVLHASAVVLPEGALVMAGPGGAGKSTLATALALAGRPLLADDLVALEQSDGHWLVHPGDAAVRLWSDSVGAVLGRRHRSSRLAHYTRKRRVEAAGLLPVADRPTPVAGVCLLTRGSATETPGDLVAPSPREALVGLVPLALQLDVRDAARHRATFEALASLVEQVPVWSVPLPPRVSEVPAFVRGVLPRLLH